MQKRFDNLASFSKPVRLPMFKGDRQSTVRADGYVYLRGFYDGFRNKVEIQPLVRDRKDGGYWEVGETYTIGASHLTRLIVTGA